LRPGSAFFSLGPITWVISEVVLRENSSSIDRAGTAPETVIGPDSESKITSDELLSAINLLANHEGV
jgi:hypothetical protein